MKHVVPVDPFVLAAKLGVDITNIDGRKNGQTPTAAPASHDTESIDLDAYPNVRDELDIVTKNPTNRSKDTHRIVAACMNARLTIEQTRWVINQRADLAERIAEFFARNPSRDDVLECWDKLEDEWQQLAANKAKASTGKTKASTGKAKTSTGQPNGGRFFGKSGLLARDLANAVMQSVTCGFGYPDQRFYVYDNGVWLPNEGAIKGEITRLLGNRYRSAHTRNVLDLIQFSPNTVQITDSPLADYVNVPNGMMQWDTGKLLPHSPDYHSTVQLPVEYDPSAQCPLFDKFIIEVLPPDLYEPAGDSLGFIWELIGYTIYSGNPLHVAILLYGEGRNGKGTLIRVLKALLGGHNCSTVGLHQLVENRFRAATLFGKLANLAGDLDSKWLDNTAMFKSITGNDTVQAENKYGAPFDFMPWALPFYSINKAFGSADSSEGWVARWVVVPFPTSFLGREDRTLDAKLQADAELRGILRRGIEALPALMARGRFAEPTSLQEAKTAFVVASDAIRAWLDEGCELDVNAWTSRRELYRAYCNHTVRDGSKILSAREFYNRMGQVNGIRPAIRTGDRGFSGVRLAAVGAGLGASWQP